MRTSREANECARAIVTLVEQSTGKTLTIEASLKIVACVQTAMNAATRTTLDEALNSGDGSYRP